MAEDLSGIVQSTQPERLARGFVFTEGPVWHPDGYLLFVDLHRNLIFRLAPGGQPEIVRTNSGRSNESTDSIWEYRLTSNGAPGIQSNVVSLRISHRSLCRTWCDRRLH